MKRILILGGGASGMTAAIAAAEHAPKGTDIVLLEQNQKLGKKLLATGNGRCNLDHAHCTIDQYFTGNQEIAAEMLAQIAQLNLPQWFSDHGLLCRETEDGRMYPYSNQAADVVNLLTYWLAQRHVQIHTDCRISSVTVNREGGHHMVQTETGDKFYGDAVICAMGGNAGPQFGTEGFGIKTAFRLGCEMEPLYPCLVSLHCDKTQVQSLSGIRVKADATLYDGAKPIHTEIGEIQFTDYGISGIAIMQLSGWLGPQYGLIQPNIQLNLFPQYTEEALTDLLIQRAAQLPNASINDYMVGLVHPQVGQAVWNAAALGSSNPAVHTLSEDTWRMLAHTFQHWTFDRLKDTGWKQAQTTGGGIALHQLDPHCFQLKNAPGIYFVGETTDCTGYCGGYNLHWAFGSGILAGIHAAKSLHRKTSN